MTKVTIFGREPAVWVGLIESALTVLLAFGLGISPETYGPWVALIVAIGGAVTAWATKDTLLSALLAAIKAGLVLVTVYGVTLSDQQTGALIAFASVLLGGWLRTQTSPTARPLDPSPQQVVIRDTSALVDPEAK
jgi:hypothetical protein